MPTPRSLVILNTGDGKGKSSAAFGVMGRAWSRGWRTCVIQFLKSPEWRTGEEKLALHLGIEWHRLGDGFTWVSTDLDETEAKVRHAWTVCEAKLASGEYDMLILDELTYGITFGWLDEEAVVTALAARADKTNVVITGRNASQGLIDLADTATDMRVIKHAYDQGVSARRGIEY
jgi:cob(I)alamin adenosyltransferase